MQQMAFEIFLDSPVLGQGPRSFSYLSLENWDPDMLWIRIGIPDFAHNEYLQVLSDYGAVGFLIIIVLLIAHGVLGTFQIIGNHDGRSEEDDLLVHVAIATRWPVPREAANFAWSNSRSGCS